MTEKEQTLIAFGPVPSRRLGRSLGINNIPPKSCSYSCIYCQVGATEAQEIEPRAFFDPKDIFKAVTTQLKAAQNAGEKIDFLTFVPDGEPTLDRNLGQTIDLLRPLGIKIAVISNASLIWQDKVRHILNKADWVSLKVDSTNETIWQQINQPHLQLELSKILEGIQCFSKDYQGILTTETMLLSGINDNPASISQVGDFLTTIRPHTAYLATPIRPPAQSTVHIRHEDKVVQAYEILNTKIDHVEYLVGYEGDAFSPTGDPIRDLLAITSVHPMREEAVRHFLSTANCDWNIIQELLAQDKIREVNFDGNRYYIRTIQHNNQEK